jgi:hypothetical protein
MTANEREACSRTLRGYALRSQNPTPAAAFSPCLRAFVVLKIGNRRIA